MIKIKALDLVSIAVTAELWLKKQNGLNFKKELEAAKALKEALYKVHWDEDTELFIDEVPF